MTLGWLFRLAGLSLRLSSGGVALLTLGYAVLVGPAPSVVRSAVMTCTFCLAALVARPARSSNTLALAGLLTLAWSPFYLFDVGCQLSFLAIAALIWLVPLAHQAVVVVACGAVGPSLGGQGAGAPLRAPLGGGTSARPPPRSAGWSLASLVVWLAALPLVAFRFHLVSPIGVLLNLPLIPLTTFALLMGAAGMALGLVWGPLAVPLLWLADVVLRWSEGIVRWGASVPWGHSFVAGPGWGSVLAFYAVLGLATTFAMALAGRAPSGRLARTRRLAPWLAAAGVLVPGWLVAWPGGSPRGLEGDVLAVGHGLGILLRLPDGFTLLYDCGRMGDPGVGRRILAPALWSRGLNRIDSVYLSHADQDHYNGLPDLLDRFRIGEVAVPPGFVSDRNPAAVDLLEAVARRGIPVRTVAAPSRWTRGATEFNVLHPPADWQPESSDNARSLVLDIAHDGRHLLLSGDLDQPGTAALMSQPPPAPIDLMLAPHHGGKSANPPTLYHWANPRAVVVSQRPPTTVSGTDALTPLERGDGLLLRTWQRGAIHFHWRSECIATRGFLDHLDHP